MIDNLLDSAKQVLNNNFQPKGFSIPCEGLYPFQWNWDSGFIAIGLCHYDFEKAKSEVKTLLDAQWSNGFIPHIVFHNESDSYFPGAEFHKSELSPYAPKDHKTTGLTQPPVLGFVLEEMYHIHKNKDEVLAFVKNHIDQVFNCHKHLYEHRDPKNEGLVYIYHNWESGTDNSPMWDEIWETMTDIPTYEFERRDTSHVDASQRPSNQEYNYYLHLIEIAKAHNYEDAKITELSPFLIQDPLFNAMLIKSNQALINLYEIIGGETEKINTLKAWNTLSKKSFNDKLYDKELKAYIHYDLRNDKPLKYVSSSSFSPLFAGVPDADRAKEIIDNLMTVFGKEEFYLCASFDPDSDKFNPKKYWRGPVWVNLNWIVYNGLKSYGYNELATRVKNETIELITKNGFYEYFDPRKEVHKAGNGGYGGNNFSWSAALLIDLLKKEN
ncbi:amylo-alpha-1,6-glucosidase [Corallibacter sp.]|uniref:amylo-alpha-1,6-glucosidase n=1 Tax=Corallibacter sp. TaxID=2038084 RepID=UPI003A9276BA